MTTNELGGDGAADTVQRRQFAVVPMWVHRKILATGTRTMALAVYVELVGRYAGSTEDAEGLRVWPQVQQIADSMGVPKRNVERAIGVLLDCEVVLKKRTVRRNQYWLPQEPPGEFAATLADFQSATSGGLDKVQTATSGGVRTATSGGFPSATSGGLYNPVPITQTQETLSPPAAPKPTAATAAASGERETEAAPTSNKPTAAQRAVRAAAALAEGEDEQAFIDWVTAKHAPRGPGWWRTCQANGDLVEHAAAWRVERTVTPAAAGSSLPDWCTKCGDPSDTDGSGWNPAMKNPNFRMVDDPATGRVKLCGACHPNTRQTTAIKPEAA